MAELLLRDRVHTAAANNSPGTLAPGGVVTPDACRQVLAQANISSEQAPTTAVSVVINCHNYARYLPTAVASVLAQSYRSFELVIVDDGSNDGSSEVAAELIRKHSDQGVTLRLLRLDDVGPTSARRAGIAASSGKYLLLLDADDKVAPTFLAKTVPVLERHPKLGFVYTDSEYFGDVQQRHRHLDYDFSRLCAGNYISYCALIRRDAYTAVGGHDQTNWGYYEDWDLWLRLGAAGWAGHRVAEPLFLYHQHFSSSLSAFARRLDPIYKAYVVHQHATHYRPEAVATARALLAEMPAGWHAKPPLRDLASIQAVLSLNPGNRHVLYFLALAQARAGGIAAAIATLRELLTRHPGDEQALELSTELTTKQGNGATPPSAPIDLRAKTVLLFTDDVGRGGAAHYNHSVLLGLRRAGATVGNAQPKHDSPLLREQAAAGVTHHWLAYEPEHDFARSFTDESDAERIISATRPDIVFFSDCCALSNLAAKEVVLRRGIPYVLICHSEAAYLAERFPQILPRATKLLRAAAGVIAVSKSSLQVLHTAFGLPPTKGTVVYNGRAQKYFSPQNPIARERIRKELGLPANAVLCLTVARHDAAKGFQFQIEAAHQLRAKQELGPLHFAWAGEGNAQAQLAALVQQAGLSDRIHMLGYRWDVTDLVDAADIFVLPSCSEALPLCIMEAMAKGVPVIASAVGGIPEELGDTGILVAHPNLDPKRTVAELAAGLSRWAKDTAARKRSGVAAKQRANELFREELMLTQTLAVIATGLAQPRGLPVTGASPAPAFQNLIREAQLALQARKPREAVALLEAAAEIAPTPEAAAKARALAADVKQKLAGAVATPAVRADNLREAENLIQQYHSSPADTLVLTRLNEIRRALVQGLLASDPGRLEGLFAGEFGRVFRSLIASGFVAEPASAELEALFRPAAGSEAKSVLSRLLAGMLVLPAHRASVPLQFDTLPRWCLDDVLAYLLAAPRVFTAMGEAEQYLRHQTALGATIVERTRTMPSDPLTLRLASDYALKLNCIPAYVAHANTRELMRHRAALLEFTLEQKGASLDANLPRSRRRRLRVGFLSGHFGAQTETHVTLPALHLDRERFETWLFPLQLNPSPVEQRCRELADHFHPLPPEVGQQVATIRGASLDVIIIGTNVTAVTNSVALLAAHRLAPIQLVNYCSPMTTGLRNVDGYLYGSLSVFPDAAEHFTEQLVVCEGAPGALDYTGEKAGTMRFDRKSLGVGEQEVLFVNAAACYKIPLELQETWASLLERVENSRLLLLPFNPNWSSRFPTQRFAQTLHAALRRRGIAEDRVILAASLPTRADVKEIERLGDVYLDTFPFSGSLSVIDPLEIGRPVVAWEGNTPRSRAAASLLRAIGLDELIAKDEAHYLTLATRLARDGAYRSRIETAIRTAMERRPKFLDPVAYGADLSDALEKLVSKRPTQRLVAV
ncbi:glycosyltransferase [Opitutus sp. ER46]|uniref:glycosyltransferase n=1 Tax=Opitutus sp. ER46 TaxID=2161864 RepID=UPI000D31CB15|nr:glycosyltransferase [Opitutus sp. ER46]PTX98422.1 hypothetical protein DB354_03900 [Opitutus sp. ER46]